MEATSSFNLTDQLIRSHERSDWGAARPVGWSGRAKVDSAFNVPLARLGAARAASVGPAAWTVAGRAIETKARLGSALGREPTGRTDRRR